ncbi:MAG: major tail protein [Ruminococcus sp.]|nr:major tail protein [Ruminococcus sp.]
MSEATVKQIVRSRYCGLRDIYVAVVTKNNEKEYVTETPVKLARALKAKITEKWTSEKIYSDDTLEEIVPSYEGTEVEIEVATLTPQDRALLFGQKYENGYLLRGKEDQAPEVALGFRTKRRNGKYEFSWLYCGKFGQGVDEEFSTIEQKIEAKSNTVKGDFGERQLDGLYQISVDESNLIEEYADAKTAITKWFEKVQEAEQAAA